MHGQQNIKICSRQSTNFVHNLTAHVAVATMKNNAHITHVFRCFISFIHGIDQNI